MPCSTWASCCGSPTSTRFRAARAHRERVGERDLAGLVDEEVVERRRRGRSSREAARPCRRASGASRQSSRVGRRSRSARPRRPTPGCRRSPSCSPRKRARARRAASTSSSSLWIALWLVEATPTRLPAREQARDQPARRPGLARAGRPLDHEVAAVERRAASAFISSRSFVCTSPVERLAPQHRLERRVAAVAGEQRAAEPLERVLLRRRVVRPAGDQRLAAAARPSSERPRLSTSRRASRSSSTISPARRPGRRIERRAAPTPSLCSCGGIGERVDRATRLLRLARRRRRAAADRLGVLEQLLRASCSSRSKNAHQTGLRSRSW